MKFLIDKKVNVGAIVIAMVYLIIFVLFMKSYINEDCNTYSTFEGDLKEVIQYVDKIDGKQIYITDKIRASYIYVLFYSKYDTRDFVKTVEYERQDVEFRNVLGFGKYKFSDIQEIEDGNVYVINKKYRNDYNLENYKVTEFEKYLVIE